MAKARRQPAEASEFVRFMTNFDQFIRNLVSGSVERIEDIEDRAFAETIGEAAIHIGANLRRECTALYRNSEGDVRQRLDVSTMRLGANTLSEGVLKLMAAPRATRGKVWDKITQIIEALKKILEDILGISIFGVSLGDLLNIGIDISEVLRVLDNIIQTIAGLFGGKALADRMYEGRGSEHSDDTRACPAAQVENGPVGQRADT